MKLIDKQILEYSRSILSDTFLQKITKESIRNELSASILEGYTKRKRLKQTQLQYSKSLSIAIATLKRIELGKCYNSELISKYSN